MKIAFFVTQFPTLSETFIANQIIDLKNRGHEIKIFATKRSGESIIHSQIVDSGLVNETVYLDSLHNSRRKKLFLLAKTLIRRPHYSNLRQFFRFARLAKRNGLSVYDYLFFYDKQDYEVVHAHFGENGNYVTKLKDCRLFCNSRFITTFHGYDLMVNQKNVRLYSRLFQICDACTVNSKYSGMKLEQLGCSATKITTLPVGLDIKFFKSESTVPKIDPLTILYVGRLVKFKAPELVLDVCQLLRRKTPIDFRLILVGDGEMKNELKAKISQLSLQPIVSFLGPKSQDEIKGLMNQADIFLFPGRTVKGRAENQGLVLQEAQAMGLPVVISDAGGMKEGIIDGITGYVVEEGNTEKFASVIEELANDATMRKRMGEAGQRFVEKNFSISLLNDQLLGIYTAQKN